MLIFIGMVTMVMAEPEIASRTAMKGILTGEVQQFDLELDDREEVYKAGRRKDIVVDPLTNIPQIFDGYTDLREENYGLIPMLGIFISCQDYALSQMYSKQEERYLNESSYTCRRIWNQNQRRKLFKAKAHD